MRVCVCRYSHSMRNLKASCACAKDAEGGGAGAMSEKIIGLSPQARAMRELVRAMRERVLGGGGCKRYSSL